MCCSCHSAKKVACPALLVLGDRDASEDQIATARDALQDCGARARVEQRLAQLLDEARDALRGSELCSDGVLLLGQLTDQLASREY